MPRPIPNGKRVRTVAACEKSMMLMMNRATEKRNGYFFSPNYPTEVAAINFDTTGTTRIGKYVLNHSFQLSGFITTFVSIGIGYLIITFLY